MKKADFLINYYDMFLQEWLEDSATDNVCKSPIEKILCAALCISKSGGVLEDELEGKRFHQNYSDFFYKIILNKRVREREKIKYYIDIALYTSGGLKFAIECDGHDYHERTKEQAKHDKERDRWLQSNGWFVARFTGSEIYNDPMEVALKIGELVFDAEAELFRKNNSKEQNAI